MYKTYIIPLIPFQDPTLIYDVPDYEPYDNLTAIEGAIKWPQEYNAPDEDKDSTNALLGYVCFMSLLFHLLCLC